MHPAKVKGQGTIETEAGFNVYRGVSSQVRCFTLPCVAHAKSEQNVHSTRVKISG